MSVSQVHSDYVWRSKVKTEKDCEADRESMPHENNAMMKFTCYYAECGRNFESRYCYCHRSSGNRCIWEIL